MKYLLFLLLALGPYMFSGCEKSAGENTISLAGEWIVRLDSLDGGTTISLPATLDDAELGRADTLSAGINNYVLSGLRRKHNYVGTARYEREVEIPADWADKEIQLELERVIWQSSVYVDGELAGTANSLVGRHLFDLTDRLSPGTHILTLAIDNSDRFPFINVAGKRYPDPDYREMAHAYTNHTQIKWNGVLGKLALTATDAAAPRDVQVYPNIENDKITVTYRQGTASPDRVSYTITGADGQDIVGADAGAISTQEAISTFTINRPEELEYWDEFNPQVYRITVDNGAGEASADFGFRGIGQTEAGLLTLNGQRIYLRGNLECAIFPLTGHPPLEKEDWLKLLGQAKDYGLNHLRFHSWCPPEAAFSAADELGFYLQVELPHWSLRVGEDAPTTAWLRQEGKHLLAEYGNHPSFLLMALGNELQGDADLLNTMVGELRDLDDRHLYATTTFSFQKPMGERPEPQDDFFVTQWTEKGWIRGQGVFNTVAPNFDQDYSANSDYITKPLISHEIGQYSVYPAMTEIDKYTGVLRPLNFISIREDLERKGLLDDAAAFTDASGKLAAMLYKEEIERALKTPNSSGFQLLQLQDFPGQGTALVGLLDAFWESKGAISAEEFRRFNSEVVPLVRFERPVYEAGETFTGRVEVANFFREMTDKTLSWSVTDAAGQTIAEGRFEGVNLTIGNNPGIGTIEWLVAAEEARELTLEVTLSDGPYVNSWNLWVYPAESRAQPGEVLITRSFAEAERALATGKTVLLNPAPEEIVGIPGRFVPVFWSPVHFPDQPGTMGLLMDPEHAALGDFPTRAHTQWQWWDLCIQSTTINMDSLAVTPIVRVIDNFVTNHRLTNLFEARVGEGRLIFSSMDISTDLTERPVARQLRSSLLNYMLTEDFSPSERLDPAALSALRSTEPSATGK